MENLIDSQHGTAVLLSCLIIVICLHLVFKIGTFVFENLNKKSESESSQIKDLFSLVQGNNGAVSELRLQMKMLERDLSEIHTYKRDIQKLFSVVKIMAGKRWPEVRKAMQEEEIFPKS